MLLAVLKQVRQRDQLQGLISADVSWAAQTLVLGLRNFGTSENIEYLSIDEELATSCPQ